MPLTPLQQQIVRTTRSVGIVLNNIGSFPDGTVWVSVPMTLDPFYPGQLEAFLRVLEETSQIRPYTVTKETKKQVLVYGEYDLRNIYS